MTNLVHRNLMPDGGWSVVAMRQTYDHTPAHSCRKPAVHGHAALAFYTRGQSRVELRGDWHVREGDVLLIPAGEPHRTVEAREVELAGLAFCVPCVVADGSASILEPFERVRDGASPVVRIRAARQEYLTELLRELERVGHDAHRKPTSLEVVQRSLLTLILDVVDESASDGAFGERVLASGRTPGGGSVVGQALRFIERHCLGPLGLTDVAEAVGKTPSYVTSTLKRATGRSAVQWIVSGRMAAARRLLLHSDDPIERIADRVGYADATHFIRMFRREHGVTPSAWRTAQATSPRLADRPSRR